MNKSKRREEDGHAGYHHKDKRVLEDGKRVVYNHNHIPDADGANCCNDGRTSDAGMFQSIHIIMLSYIDHFYLRLFIFTRFIFPSIFQFFNIYFIAIAIKQTVDLFAKMLRHTHAPVHYFQNGIIAVHSYFNSIFLTMY
jgi:hypothetical protein